MQLEEYEQAEAYYSAHPCTRVRQLWLVYSLLSNGADEQRELDLDEWVERAKIELRDADSRWLAEQSKEA
jgi:hypothetical protein